MKNKILIFLALSFTLPAFAQTVTGGGFSNQSEQGFLHVFDNETFIVNNLDALNAAAKGSLDNSLSGVDTGPITVNPGYLSPEAFNVYSEALAASKNPSATYLEMNQYNMLIEEIVTEAIRSSNGDPGLAIDLINKHDPNTYPIIFNRGAVLEPDAILDVATEATKFESFTGFDALEALKGASEEDINNLINGDF